MMGRYGLLCVIAVLLGCSSKNPAPPAEPFGRFEGEVVGAWSDEPRNITLKQGFAYVDPRNKKWVAPAGSVINGASIPQPFWSVIGGPFEGEYRNASVVHDVACEDMKEKWEDVHLMFYEACRCGGVGESKAKLMYWAVYHFGPRWETVSEIIVIEGKPRKAKYTRPVATPGPDPDIALAKRADEYFSSNDPSLEEVRRLKLDGK